MKKLILLSISILSIFIVVFIHSCKKQDVYRVIKISTDTITNISDTTALIFGTIIDTGKYYHLHRMQFPHMNWQTLWPRSIDLKDCTLLHKKHYMAR